MQSGPKRDLWEQDTTLEILMMKAETPTSSLLTSTFKPYSGDSPTKKMTISSLMELQTKKKPLKLASNLEATQEETPQIQTSQYPSAKTPKKKNLNL